MDCKAPVGSISIPLQVSGNKAVSALSSHVFPAPVLWASAIVLSLGPRAPPRAPGNNTVASMPRNGIVRFGNFEVDLPSGELRRGGLKVKLSGQPFEVLVTLLEKPGQVVTREELHQKLWARDTFVDFEHGLNKAINKVREALGDDADNPRFVETLPRRGYRFLAPVRHPAQPEVDVGDNRARVADPIQATSPAPTETLRAKPGLIWLPAFGAAAIILAVLLVLTGSPRPPRVLSYTQLTDDGVPKGHFATDGSRIYFSESAPKPVIAQVSVKGGAVSTFAQLPNLSGTDVEYASVLDYSPVRSELLIGTGLTDSRLWAISVPGGSAPRRLGDAVVVNSSATWSPDGQSLVYGKNKELYIASAEGGDSRKLATVKGNAVDLR